MLNAEDFPGVHLFPHVKVPNAAANQQGSKPYLEIGPKKPISDKWIGLDLKHREGWSEDDMFIARWGKEKFPNHLLGKFSLVYASHVLEHIPWYHSYDAICNAIDLLVPGGWLEIWVPDAFRIAKAYVEGNTGNDAWRRFNPDGNVTKWFAGRMYAYGDGVTNFGDENFHRACFDVEYLTSMFCAAGLTKVKQPNRPRGNDHGWINLGMRGVKK